MAEAVLFDIAGKILKGLDSPTLQEIGLVCKVNSELKRLNNTISMIKPVLLDAEEQQATNHAIKEWLGKIKDAVYDVDGLLDDFSTEGLWRKVMTYNKIAKEVRNFLSSSNQLAFGLRMAHKVKAVRERLDTIAIDISKFQFREIHVEISGYKETHSYVHEDATIGRNDDKKAIIDLLLKSGNDKNVSVISIVGIGGVGKTALAQLVYNDEKVKKQFEPRMWICISGVFDVEIIVKKILESATSEKFENSGMDLLQSSLKQEIGGEKYLIVLDDVRIEDREKWLTLENLLMSGARGSKIVITARSQLVAKSPGSSSVCNLKGLSSDESWSLFMKVAFRNEKDANNQVKVEIGKHIVGKCAGVPLALRTIGAFLYQKTLTMSG